MKFREVYRYELAHRLRSPSTWVYVALMFAIAALMILENANAVEAVNHNAPAKLARIILDVSLFGMVFTAALFGDAAVRDVQAGMDPLLYTSSVSRAEYLGGRYLAALTVNAILSLIALCGIALPTLIGYPDPAMFGPFRILAFVQPWLLFLLPNIALIGALMFSVGVLSRQVLAVYLSGIVIFFIFLFLDDGVLGTWGPPGIAVLQDVTQRWTAAEWNAQLIGFPTAVLVHRLIWLGIAVAVLILMHRRFRFAQPEGRARRSRKPVDAPASVSAASVSVPAITGSFGVRTTWRQTLAIARNSLIDVAAGLGFVAALIIWLGLTLIWGARVGRSAFDTTMWPVTHLIVESFLSIHATPIFVVLIALFAGELVWKDRDVSAAEMLDATPVPEGAALLGRFLALVCMIALLLTASIVGGILSQAFRGYFHFDVGLYFRILFGPAFANFALIAALALTIHVLVNHKYIGHIVVLLVCAFPFVAQENEMLRHHLLLFGTDPGWEYSDMNGFGAFMGPFAWFKLYWAAWALLLGVVTCLLWVRGRESGIRSRLNQARARITVPLVRTAGVATLLIVLLGGFIFYNTNVLNEYRTTDEQGAPSAAYAKRYGSYEDIAQPAIAGVQLRVEIYPDAHAVDLRGSYNLVNRSGAVIDSVHVYLNPDIEARSLSLNRAATPVVVDEEAGYRIFALAQPLAPGDSLRLAFDVAFRQRGFPNSGLQTNVAGSGAYFNRDWLPSIGKSGVRNENVTIDATIGTAADQIAITPGVLRRSWTENRRRYFHYSTERPTAFDGSVFSSEYSVREDRWNGVALQVFHHPTHTFDLDRMVHGMKASLEYFTAQFGPYPDSQLRIVEFPSYVGFGNAHPHTIAFAENAFLSRIKDGDIDVPFYRTARGVAHQWWPGQLRTASVQGYQFLSESLANYSALMVVEKTHGPEVARRLYDFQMDLYLTGSASQAREVPVLEVTDQSYIADHKGAIALYTLRDQIGEESVNTALRRFLEKRRDTEPPYATSLDLLAELRAVTPDSLQYLLTDLFETVTLWDVKTTRAVVDSIGTGEYSVTLDVVAKKMRADSTGNETEVQMDDFVEIGVFAPGERGKRGESLHLQRHRIRSGAQTIRITVPRQPALAGIDPWRKLIDRNPADNVAAVKAVTRPGQFTEEK